MRELPSRDVFSYRRMGSFELDNTYQHKESAKAGAQRASSTACQGWHQVRQFVGATTINPQNMLEHPLLHSAWKAHRHGATEAQRSCNCVKGLSAVMKALQKWLFSET